MAKNKVAIITGITGQDGSYLAELLLFLGYQVHGILRPASTFNRSRIEHIISNNNYRKRFFLHYGDLTDSASIYNLLIKLKPDEFYNLAAQSHVGISFQLQEYSNQVNGNAVATILQSIRNLKLDTKFYQACTSEMFGAAKPPQSIKTDFHPQSPYASAKVFAYNICRNYRDGYGLYVSCGILFNHESFRRGLNFVTKKIVNSAVKTKNGLTSEIRLGNINSFRDWGWAPEYVLAIHSLMQISNPTDTVVGTGISGSVNEFLDYTYSKLDLDYRDFLILDKSYERPLEVENLCADNSDMKKKLGWTPKIHWKKLIDIMLEDELRGFENSINWEKII